MPTIKDIQLATGLSLSTISKYINGGTIRAENRIKIEKAIAQTGFRVNRFARSLKTNKSQTIGVTVPQTDSLYYSHLASICERTLRHYGNSALICGSQNDNSIEEENISFLLDEQVDGIIAMIWEPSGKLYKIAEGRCTPVVYIDRQPTQQSVSFVGLDYCRAIQMSVREMVSYGHKRIAHIGGKYHHRGIPNTTFLQTMEEFGIEPNQDYIKLGDCFTTAVAMREAYANMQKLLLMPQRPSGIICSDHSSSIACVFAIRDAGLRIPQDISFICMDSSYIMDLLHPKMTAMLAPLEDIVQAAVSLLMSQIENKNTERCDHVIFKPSLYRGNSVAAPSQI